MSEASTVTGLDDRSLFVCARLVARAMARPVSEALVAAMRAHGVPAAILTANGKVLTAGFGSNLVASRAFSEVLAGSVLRWQNRSLDAAAAVAELV